MSSRTRDYKLYFPMVEANVKAGHTTQSAVKLIANARLAEHSTFANGAKFHLEIDCSLLKTAVVSVDL